MSVDAAGNDATAGRRLAYLDNLKVLLVAGVIAVHSGITYGVEGAWYLEDYEPMGDVGVGVLTVFVAVGFLFGLGAFFLIAGRLSGPSLDRKGPARFVGDRLVRLGIPVVFYVVLIAPVMEYVKARNEGEEESFWSFAWSQLSDPAPGPTWFLEALLLFSLGYALLRALRPGHGPVSHDPLRGRQVAAAGDRRPRVGAARDDNPGGAQVRARRDRWRRRLVRDHLAAHADPGCRQGGRLRAADEAAGSTSAGHRPAACPLSCGYRHPLGV